MKRRTWLTLVSAALAGACRKHNDGTPEPPGPPPDVAWTPLSGKWTGAEGGAVTEENGVLKLGFGELLTAARWTGQAPGPPFELEYEARRINGSDFFGAVTFAVRKDEFATFVIGGWGGGLVGISSVDGMDAAENETGTAMQFTNGEWYRVRLIRADEKIEVWINGEKAVDLDTENRRLSLRPGPISACVPFGFGSWQSSAEIRRMKWRSLPPTSEDLPDGRTTPD